MRGYSFLGLPMLAPLEREKGTIMLLKKCVTEWMHKGLKSTLCYMYVSVYLTHTE